MDSLIEGMNKKALHLYIGDYKSKIGIALKKKKDISQFKYEFPQETPWTKAELYALEYHYLGESFSIKPRDAYDKFFSPRDDQFKNIKSIEMQRIDASQKDPEVLKQRLLYSNIKGIIRSFYETRVKKEGSKAFGKKMGKLIIEDAWDEQITITVFPDQWASFQQSLLKSKVKLDNGIAIHFSGQSNYFNNNVDIILNELYQVRGIPELPKDFKTKKSVAVKREKKEVKPEIKAEERSVYDEIEEDMVNDGCIDTEYNGDED
jgi:hypothetical protein